MAPRFVAVLDVGKTNVKVVLHDLATGLDVATESRPNAVVAGPPYPHYDVGGIWNFACRTLRVFARERQVDALAVTTHGAAAVLVDETGGLALPVLDYEHAGIDETSAAYEAERPGFAETFSPRLPMGLNIGAQLFWQRRRFPEAFGRATSLLGYPQWFALRLTGARAIDVTSLGCHSDLWNPVAGRPSTMAGRLGFAALMAKVVTPFDRLGSVTAAAAAETGLAEGTPVFAGIHDSNASLLPHLMARPAPFSVVSSGTWAVMLAVGVDPAGLDPTRDTLANVDAFGRPVPSARFMGGREMEIIAGGADARSSSAADVERVVTAGAMALPGFVPGTGPFPNAAGRWTADPDSLSPGERWAAASLYAALMIETSLALIGAEGPILAEGPFARNDVILGTLAALIGRPVIAAGQGTGTSRGAALTVLGPGARLAVAHEERPVAPLSVGSLDLDAYARAWRSAAGR